MSMLSKISVSVMVATALFGASMRLPAASCILSNMPSEKACTPGCCANKTCCKTSQKNTAPPVQPLAKSGFNQQNIVALPAMVAVALPNPAVATESPVFSSAECTAHSPAPLALICIRLI
jgi:hypothetical protein